MERLRHLPLDTAENTQIQTETESEKGREKEERAGEEIGTHIPGNDLLTRKWFSLAAKPSRGWREN